MPTVLLSPSSKSDVVEAVSSVSSAFRAVTLYFCSALVCASYLYLWFIISSIILLYIVDFSVTVHNRKDKYDHYLANAFSFYDDAECDLDIVPNEPRKADLNIVMSNSLGFGGHNASIILKKYEK